jgi:hypothetical protein
LDNRLTDIIVARSPEQASFSFLAECLGGRDGKDRNVVHALSPLLAIAGSEEDCHAAHRVERIDLDWLAARQSNPTDHANRAISTARRHKNGRGGNSRALPVAAAPTTIAKVAPTPTTTASFDRGGIWVTPTAVGAAGIMRVP